MKFQLASDYEPRGDQPQAIDQLVRGRYRWANAIRYCWA